MTDTEDFVFPTANKQRGTRDTTKPRGRPASNTRRQQSLDALRKEITTSVQDVGRLVALFEEYDGTVIFNGAEGFATGWVRVAETNDTMRKVLEGLLQSSAWGAAIGGTIAIALPILIHHNLIPAFPGMGPPATVHPIRVDEPVYTDDVMTETVTNDAGHATL